MTQSEQQQLLHLQQQPQEQPSAVRIKKRNVWLYAILSVVTGFVFYVVWLVLTAIQLNRVTGKKRNVFLSVIGLLTVPFYGVWWFDSRAKDLTKATREMGLHAEDNHILYAMLSALIYPFVAVMAITAQLNTLAQILKGDKKTDKQIKKSLNPAVMVLLSVLTLGIYYIWWLNSLVKLTHAYTNRPSSTFAETACLLLIPFYAAHWFELNSQLLSNSAKDNLLFFDSDKTEFLLLGLCMLDILACCAYQSKLNFIADQTNVKNITYVQKSSLSLFLCVITLGIYYIIWLVRLNRTINCYVKRPQPVTAKTLCALFVPFYIVVWQYRCAKSYQTAAAIFSDHAYTKNAVVAFFCPMISLAVAQSELNYIIAPQPQIPDKKELNVIVKVLLSVLCFPLCNFFFLMWYYKLIKSHQTASGGPVVPYCDFACSLLVPFYMAYSVRKMAQLNCARANNANLSIGNFTNSAPLFVLLFLYPVAAAQLEVQYRLLKDQPTLSTNHTETICAAQTATTSSNKSQTANSDRSTVLFASDTVELRLQHLRQLKDCGIIDQTEYDLIASTLSKENNNG